MECRGIYPYERSLVQQLGGRRFVLLGVNNDEDREAIRFVSWKERLNWRSWWDGAEGQIVNRWGVQSWPTIFLIDHQGVIRYRGLYGREFEKSLARLIAEAEPDAAH